MKIKTLLDEYAESHQNPKNIAIHKICVPAITFTVVCFLSLIPWQFQGISFIYFVMFLVCIYYARLSLKYLAIFFPFLLVFLGMSYFFKQQGILLELCISVFVLAWIGQFYGHKIEGKKPSFFKDIQFLLIGPLWTIKTIFNLS